MSSVELEELARRVGLHNEAIMDHNEVMRRFHETLTTVERGLAYYRNILVGHIGLPVDEAHPQLSHLGLVLPGMFAAAMDVECLADAQHHFEKLASIVRAMRPNDSTDAIHESVRAVLRYYAKYTDNQSARKIYGVYLGQDEPVGANA